MRYLLIMDIIINSSQKNRLLLESEGEGIPKKLRKAKLFASNVIDDVGKQIGIDLKFLSTWGASIGGIMHPLNQFIQGESVEINNFDISLIIVGSVSLVFFNNIEVFNTIKDKIKEKGLVETLKLAIKKTEELKDVFVRFISGLNMSLHQMTNIISYAFIIPILPAIYEIATNQETSKFTIELIIKRIVASISVTLSGILVKELINKLIRKFSNKH